MQMFGLSQSTEGDFAAAANYKNNFGINVTVSGQLKACYLLSLDDFDICICICSLQIVHCCCGQVWSAPGGWCTKDGLVAFL